MAWVQATWLLFAATATRRPVAKEHCRHALYPHRTRAPALLDALGVVLPRLPPEDRIVLRPRWLRECVREKVVPTGDGLAAAGRPLRGERG